MKNEKEYVLEMANVIWRTLFWHLNTAQVLSWGIRKRTATYYRDMPALELQVNGMVHKGIVVIAYNEGNDLFEVYLLDKNRNCTQSMEGIYAEDLGNLIDETIERPKNVTDVDVSP